MSVTFSEFCEDFDIETPINLNDETHKKVLDIYESIHKNKMETVHTSESTLDYVDTLTGEIVATKRLRKADPYTKPIDQCECVEDLQLMFSSNTGYNTTVTLKLSEYISNTAKDPSKLLVYLCDNILGSNKGVVLKEDLGSVVEMSHLSRTFRTLENDGVLRRIKTQLPKKYIVYAVSPWFCFRGNKWAEDHTKEHWVRTNVS